MRADMRQMRARVISTGLLFLPRRFACSCAPASTCKATRWTDLSLYRWQITKNKVLQSFISSYHGIILILYPRDNACFETGPLKYFFPSHLRDILGKPRISQQKHSGFDAKEGNHWAASLLASWGTCSQEFINQTFFVLVGEECFL